MGLVLLAIRFASALAATAHCLHRQLSFELFLYCMQAVFLKLTKSSLRMRNAKDFKECSGQDSLYKHGLPFIPPWISNDMSSKVWDEITYLYPNLNGSTVEVWEWRSNFISHFIMEIITYPYWDKSSTMLVNWPHVLFRKKLFLNMSCLQIGRIDW